MKGRKMSHRGVIQSVLATAISVAMGLGTPVAYAGRDSRPGDGTDYAADPTLYAMSSIKETSSGVYTGECGTSGLRWTLDTHLGNITISGSGMLSSPWDSWGLDEFYIGSPPTLPYPITVDFEYAHTLVIDEGVTGLCKSAFAGTPTGYRDLEELRTVLLPDSLTEIGAGAFYRCPKLASINIGRNVKKIGNNAFANCAKDFVIYGYMGTEAERYAKANGIDFYALDQTAENDSWADVSSLTGSCGQNAKWKMDFEKKTLTISGTGAVTKTFWEWHDTFDKAAPSGLSGDERKMWVGNLWNRLYANSLNLLVDEGITSICEGAFTETVIVSAILPDSLKTIGDRAFNGCTKLAEVVIQEGVTSIGDDCFAGCNVTLFGTAGSYAQKYAWENNIRFIPRETHSLERDKYINQLRYERNATWHFPNDDGGVIEEAYWKALYGPSFGHTLFGTPDENTNGHYYGGYCFGMVAAAQMIAAYKWPSFDKDTYSIDKSDVALLNKERTASALDLIKMAHGPLQQDPYHCIERSNNFGDLNGLRKAVIENVLGSDGSVPVTINVYDPGHSIWAIGIGADDSEKTEIIVYDPNCPGLNRHDKLTLWKNSTGNCAKWEYDGYGTDHNGRITWETPCNRLKALLEFRLNDQVFKEYETLVTGQLLDAEAGKKDEDRLDKGEGVTMPYEIASELEKQADRVVGVPEPCNSATGTSVSDRQICWCSGAESLTFPVVPSDARIVVASSTGGVGVTLETGAVLTANVKNGQGNSISIDQPNGSRFEVEYFDTESDATSLKSTTLAGVGADKITSYQRGDEIVIKGATELLFVDESGKKTKETGLDATSSYAITRGGGASQPIFRRIEGVGGPVPSTPSSTSVNQSGDGTGGSQSCFKTRRLSGNSRYDTMSAIVSDGFSRSDWAVVASGSKFADALAASALAGVRGCPVILTKKDSLSKQAESQLKRLGVKNIYLMGGVAAMSQKVEGAIKSMGIGVTRVAGNNRYGTCKESFQLSRSVNSSSDTLVIVSGRNFADALSIGPWSYAKAVPIVLARKDGKLSTYVVDAVKADSGIRRVLIVGGTSAVSDGVKAQLGDSFSYERIGGATRYETSALVAEWVSKNGLGWSKVAVATGKKFPDALSAAALCGKRSSVLLLVNSIGDPTVNILSAHRDEVSTCHVLGGQEAMSDSLAFALDNMIR